MSQENVEKLRRAFDAFSRGDLDAAVADVDPSVEYISTGAILDQADVARSSEEFKQLISWLFDVFDDARLEPKEFIDAGDKVVGAFSLSGRGKQSGVEASFTMWQVWTVKDGRFVHGQGFTVREEALEAAGLRESGG